MNGMEKKNHGRFNIQFTVTDPEHLQAIEILNSLPPRSKAPYIAKALVHLENCDATPAIRRNPALDRKALESIIREILLKEANAPPAPRPATESTERSNPISETEDSALNDAYEAFGEENIGTVLAAIDMFN